MKNKIIIIASIFSLFLSLGYWIFFSSLSSQKEAIYIYKTDSSNIIDKKIKNKISYPKYLGLKCLTSIFYHDTKFKPGKYNIYHIGVFGFFRNLKNHKQSPIKLTIPIVHTKEDLCKFLANKFSSSYQDFLSVLNDSTICQKFHKTPQTILCLFIPNTYEIYWDTTPIDLLKRMNKESIKWWTPKKLLLAKKSGLSPDEVYTLASIIEQETTNNKEKNMIAGMYLNRYHKDMKLQADPTVKFAANNFTLRRITGNILKTDSPYNTYLYKGLPPGPICIPSISSIESVLHFTTHNYIYMCAKEDFSGTHNFATTYEEHKLNAKKYTDALNNKGIH